MRKAVASMNQDNHLNGNLSIADYPKITSTRTEDQQQYILRVLQLFGSANTIELEALGIKYPPARIRELRLKGVNIRIAREPFYCHAGIKHQRISRYFLSASNDSNQLTLFEPLQAKG